MKRYMVKEIFGPTIQGEGYNAGTATMFLRLSNCNRWSGKAEDKPNSFCYFCDTDFVGGTRMTPDEILVALREKSQGIKRVVITGGEPMLQIHDGSLVQFLHNNGYAVMIETNGSIASASGNRLAWITMSPKQSSDETKLDWADEVKILFPTLLVEDFLTSRFKGCLFYLQPIDVPDIKYRVDNLHLTLAEVYRLNALGFPIKLSAQTHKLIGVP